MNSLPFYKFSSAGNDRPDLPRSSGPSLPADDLSQATRSSETEFISGGWTTPAGPIPAAMLTRHVGAQGGADRPAIPTCPMMAVRGPLASTHTRMGRCHSRVQTVKPGSGAGPTAPPAGHGYERKGIAGRRKEEAAKSADSDRPVRTDAVAKTARARSLACPETGTPKGHDARRIISACLGGMPYPNSSAILACWNLETVTGSRRTVSEQDLEPHASGGQVADQAKARV